ncbi:MAG: hypothetical protein NT033_07440, partial [Candidatus Omnitrophica bacterium]|nr:hypothetical protein [Candidatus Omnitrophota bacterium]
EDDVDPLVKFGLKGLFDEALKRELQSASEFLKDECKKIAEGISEEKVKSSFDDLVKKALKKEVKEAAGILKKKCKDITGLDSTVQSRLDGIIAEALARGAKGLSAPEFLKAECLEIAYEKTMKEFRPYLMTKRVGLPILGYPIISRLWGRLIFWIYWLPKMVQVVLKTKYENADRESPEMKEASLIANRFWKTTLCEWMLFNLFIIALVYLFQPAGIPWFGWVGSFVPLAFNLVLTFIAFGYKNYAGMARLISDQEGLDATVSLLSSRWTVTTAKIRELLQQDGGFRIIFRHVIEDMRNGKMPVISKAEYDMLVKALDNPQEWKPGALGSYFALERLISLVERHLTPHPQIESMEDIQTVILQVSGQPDPTTVPEIEEIDEDGVFKRIMTRPLFAQSRIWEIFVEYLIDTEVIAESAREMVAGNAKKNLTVIKALEEMQKHLINKDDAAKADLELRLRQWVMWNMEGYRKTFLSLHESAVWSVKMKLYQLAARSIGNKKDDETAEEYELRVAEKAVELITPPKKSHPAGVDSPAADELKALDKQIELWAAQRVYLLAKTGRWKDEFKKGFKEIGKGYQERYGDENYCYLGEAGDAVTTIDSWAGKGICPHFMASVTKGGEISGAKAGAWPLLLPYIEYIRAYEGIQGYLASRIVAVDNRHRQDVEDFLYLPENLKKFEVNPNLAAIGMTYKAYGEEHSDQAVATSIGESTFNRTVQMVMGDSLAEGGYGKMILDIDKMKLACGIQPLFKCEDTATGMRIAAEGFDFIHTTDIILKQSIGKSQLESMGSFHTRFPASVLDLSMSYEFWDLLRSKNTPRHVKLFLLFNFIFYYKKPVIRWAIWANIILATVLPFDIYAEFFAAVLFISLSVMLSQIINFQSTEYLRTKVNYLAGAFSFVRHFPKLFQFFTPAIPVYAEEFTERGCEGLSPGGAGVSEATNEIRRYTFDQVYNLFAPAMRDGAVLTLLIVLFMPFYPVSVAIKIILLAMVLGFWNFPFWQNKKNSFKDKISDYLIYPAIAFCRGLYEVLTVSIPTAVLRTALRLRGY